VTRTKASIRVAGFTLVELMIVVVVVAILASIAIPSYQSQIRKSRRTDAKTAVLDLAAREEKYLSLNNSYTSSPANLGYGTATSFTTQYVSNGYYLVYVCIASTAGSTSSTTPCTAATATTAGTSYVVAAIPVTGTTQASDSSCQYFAIDNTGTHFASASTAGTGSDVSSTCWQ
jgi:type IV pilus assembly protein PilE